jgi:hypothetical protein
MKTKCEEAKSFMETMMQLKTETQSASAESLETMIQK